MRKLQTQGVHHITIVGADRQTSIDFWEGVLGMPFVFEQPNLDRASESHLYFDPGDGRPYRRPLSARLSSGWMSGASSIPGRRIAASWIRSISTIRSAC